MTATPPRCNVNHHVKFPLVTDDQVALIGSARRSEAIPTGLCGTFNCHPAPGWAEDPEAAWRPGTPSTAEIGPAEVRTRLCGADTLCRWVNVAGVRVCRELDLEVGAVFRMRGVVAARVVAARVVAARALAVAVLVVRLGLV